MGRRPTTDAQKVQRGTNQPCRMKKGGKSAVTSPPVKLPSPPKYLHERGRIIWKKYGKSLMEQGLLAENEFLAFGRFCQEMGLYEQLMEELQDEHLIVTLPNFIQTPNPKLKLAHDCQDRADRLGRQFGLSPSSRKDMPAQKNDNKPHPLAGLL